MTLDAKLAKTKLNDVRAYKSIDSSSKAHVSQKSGIFVFSATRKTKTKTVLVVIQEPPRPASYRTAQTLCPRGDGCRFKAFELL